jgi:hypothetical protein
MDEEVQYGPYEYYHNENDEPMFRQWKVRHIEPIFMKEDNFYDYTLEKFKEWFKRTINEDDWSYIHIWGGLDDFSSSTVNNEILEYLFQLGKSPLYIYTRTLESIDSFEEDLDDPTCDKEFTIEMLDNYRELLNICEKYISEEDRILAFKLKHADWD